MIHESSKKILVIEDDAVTRNLFLEVLETQGFDAIGAEDGLAGIQQAQEHLPDLVICDIQMPNMDGYSVCTRLQQYPDTAIIPFIFSTGSNTQTDIRKGMDLGADDYLTKPFLIEDLLRAIEVRLKKQANKRCWYATNSHQAAQPLPLSLNSESIFPSIPQLQAVFDFIEANYSQGITLSDVALAVGYSPAYLTNRVAKQTGETVNGWIVKRRMAAARPLLRDTNQTIDQIAIALGYKNTCHFSRQFRQHHEISPKIWRKQQQRLQPTRSAKLQFIKNRGALEKLVPLGC
ncbi:MAG: DNA-binding response regulator [Nostoc sp. ChiQUE02]|uniref:DNA-binding response regulator n=1 Tax=Nostoc sp. ChiQUE02 TaxID=3075377 RepID=UPI002AD486D8|nr:DNA-binding response regulator [Nostoc sp. ChiQUE02]MDZ8233381.1 DNA-binding response regulator [Nostoc sp. ChiQUE02]